MTDFTGFQGGQSDLELAAARAGVALAPFVGTTPLLGLEDPSTGDLDLSALWPEGVPVGNWEKGDGVTLSNKPTRNKIKSHGYGSPTRTIAVEAERGIKYTPQETKLVNLQNAWGFTPDMVTVSAKGGVTIAIPELPVNLHWRCVLITQDYYNGKPLYRYWIANKTEVGDNDDNKMTDGDVDKYGVSLNFLTDPAVGNPVIFGICGPGWLDLKAATDTGFDAAITGITVTPSTASLTVSAGSSHTKQLAVADSNSVDRTAVATYSSSDAAKATVSSTGLVTAVATGSATITATYKGKTATCAATVGA